MNKIPYLKAGDKVGVVSPAKLTTAEELQIGLQQLSAWGLEGILGAHVYAQDHFFAGTDEQRASDLQHFLNDPEIKAIFFTKGAYGVIRIIDRIDFTLFKQNPKWLVGYSDITFLHEQLNGLGFESLHAVMLQGYATCTKASLDSLHTALFGSILNYEWPAHTANKNTHQAVEGTLVGGNLSILYASLGAASTLQTDGKILFIEDIDEYRYHFDRMLVALKRAGKLNKLKGLVVGGLTDIKDSTLPYGHSAEEIILEQLREFDYPIYFGFPAGHQSDNRALIMGRTVKISPVADKVLLQFNPA